MRKSLLIFSFAFFAFGLSAQQFVKSPVANQKAFMNKHMADGFERVEIPAAQNPFVDERTEIEVIIGTTTYDLQSNNSTRNSLSGTSDGEMYATWTMGNSVGDGYSDRGTGYTTFSDGEWADPPTERIESERTGWGNVALLGDGSQFVVAHTVNNEFITNRNPDGVWIEDKIPTDIPVGLLWPRCAVGGADDMTVHVIGISTPTALGGGVWEGLDGHLVYYRSTDGGATWDMQDVKLPGMDDTKYTFTSADSYNVEANGETVAIALFAAWGDVAVTKSSDNGSTFETSVIKDFPFDPYTIDTPYDTNLITDPNIEVGLQGNAFQSSDNAGDIIVDNTGNIHVFYGEMYYLDEDFTDGNWNFFPGWSGLRYWNESFGEDSTRVIADLLDEDGDGLFGVGANEFGSFGNNLTSLATAGVDAQNVLYVAYAGVTELFPNANANPGLQYPRHIYTMASTDNGETWSNPVDLIREDIVQEPDLLPAIEAMYPSMTHDVGSVVDIIYQEDFEPGQSVSADTDPAGTNFIIHLAVTKDEFSFEFEIAPNPAQNWAQVSYKLPETSQINISVVNMMGQLVDVVGTGSHAAGNYTEPLDLSNLSKGVYLVQFQANDQIAVQKLIVE